MRLSNVGFYLYHFTSLLVVAVLCEKAQCCCDTQRPYAGMEVGGERQKTSPLTIHLRVA